MSAIPNAIQIHPFDFVISGRVLQFDLRVNIDMDSWFSFYLYLQRCDVTRYIRTIIYPYTHNCQKRMPDGAWLILDECSHVVIAMSKVRTA